MMIFSIIFLEKVGVSGHVGTEMCFANLLYVSVALPTVTPLLKGDCTSQEVTFFPTASTTPFNSNPKLALHALYGNQTGTVQITSNGNYFMNLVMQKALKTKFLIYHLIN